MVPKRVPIRVAHQDQVRKGGSGREGSDQGFEQGSDQGCDQGEGSNEGSDQG